MSTEINTQVWLEKATLLEQRLHIVLQRPEQPFNASKIAFSGNKKLETADIVLDDTVIPGAVHE